MRRATILFLVVVSGVLVHLWAYFWNKPTIMFLRSCQTKTGKENEANLTEVASRPNLFPPPSVLSTLPDFQFTLNHDVCGNDTVDLLILVGSHPNNAELRHVLRATWDSTDYVIKLVFLFGKPEIPLLNGRLVHESARYRDIVQGNFRDCYHNVTFRDLMGLRWARRQCEQARFVMHADDDVAIDLDRLLQAMDDQLPRNGDFVACDYLLVNTSVLREGRYAVTREEYDQDIYPPYCNGWVYLLTPGAARALEIASRHIRPIWMNDAYLTGILMQNVSLKHQQLHLPMTTNQQELASMSAESPLIEPRFVYGPTGGNASLTQRVQERFRTYHAQFNSTST